MELDKLKALALYPLPHHWVSRVIFHATRLRLPFIGSVIRWFIKQFDVDMQDSLESDIGKFDTFNAFFTRQLKPEARPLPADPVSIVSPADGKISQFGKIRQGTLVQAKGRDYSVQSLLACEPAIAEIYNNGSFATVYLSPRDYHRVHSPIAGTLLRTSHVPGRLFSVAPYTVKHVPSLFARNERVIAEFDTVHGRIAVVLVGAINVAAIETVWDGLVTPPAGKSISERHYSNDAPRFSRGEEIGRFNMGSTVIFLSQQEIQWDPSMELDMAVKMGTAIGLPA